MARLLVEQGADLERRDDLGQTPRQIVSTFNDAKMIKAVGLDKAPAKRRRPGPRARETLGAGDLPRQ